jgi:hypothetical protein
MSEIKKEMAAYTKVWNTIRSAHYIHFENGSLLNLINNFGNMYNSSNSYYELLNDYKAKLKQFESN